MKTKVKMDFKKTIEGLFMLCFMLTVIFVVWFNLEKKFVYIFDSYGHFITSFYIFVTGVGAIFLSDVIIRLKLKYLGDKK